MINEVLEKDLRLSGKQVRARSQPFFWGVIPEFFPADTYQALADTFPPPELLNLSPEGDKLRLRHLRDKQQFDDVLRDRPLWRSLFEAMQQQEFLTSVHHLVEPALRAARGTKGALPFVVTDSAAGHPDGQPVSLEFEFSILKNGAYVPPHTDAPRKLVSLLFYFPPEDWHDEWSGHTEFYKPRKPRQNFNWHNQRAEFADLEEIGQASYRSNQVGVFVKSRNSYHGVPPIRCPDGAIRRSVNVNIWLPYKAPSIPRRLKDRGAKFAEGLINDL